jgi:CheY-like chemotaxis protein
MADNTILIADDDSSDIWALRSILRKSGIRNPVQTVTDGVEVISYLSGDGKFADRSIHPFPGLLFLDLMMPRKSGMDVLQWTRNGAPSQVKMLAIVVASAVGNINEIRQAYNLGAHSFMTKPYNEEDFMNLVSGHPGIRIELTTGGRFLHFDEHHFASKW